jgi:serine/threonine-protein kinase
VLRDGTIKMVDFGLARIEASNLTETGTLLGTPAYMSPEQFLGLPVDARSDIFSAGVILYQMLTGDRPFTGSPTTIMQKVLRQDPVQPSVLNPTLSETWDDLIKRALAKKPDDRIQTARQFAEFVRLAFEGKPLPGVGPAADATVVIDATVRIAPPKPEKRSKLPLVAGIATAAVAVVAAGAAWFSYRAAQRLPTEVVAHPVQPALKPVEPLTAVEKKPLPEKKRRAEKKVVKLEKPAPPPPAAPAMVARAQPAPPAGKVVSLDRSWGFLVVQSPEQGIKVGDRLYATMTDGRRVPIVVRRISGSLVSAVPEGQKISDDMLGASVSQR